MLVLGFTLKHEQALLLEQLLESYDLNVFLGHQKIDQVPYGLLHEYDVEVQNRLYEWVVDLDLAVALFRPHHFFLDLFYRLLHLQLHGALH
jgi:hypothetical protein